MRPTRTQFSIKMVVYQQGLEKSRADTASNFLDIYMLPAAPVAPLPPAMVGQQQDVRNYCLLFSLCSHLYSSTLTSWTFTSCRRHQGYWYLCDTDTFNPILVVVMNIGRDDDVLIQNFVRRHHMDHKKTCITGISIY